MIASTSSYSLTGIPSSPTDSVNPWSTNNPISGPSIRRRPHTRQSSSQIDDDDHPLDRGSGSHTPEEDVSRPALRRLTSETERHVAESSRSGASDGTGSVRGSFDLLRMSTVEESKEVEVLIHQVCEVCFNR
jgi:hypothetical protein